MNVIKKFFDVVPNSLKNYLIDKFLEKKKITRFLICLIIIFFIKMIYDIYSGYSKGLKLTNLISWIPLSTLFKAIFIPSILFLYFFILTIRQIKESPYQGDQLYFFKVSCCLQINFYIIFAILIFLIEGKSFDIYALISMMVCFVIIALFFSLYFKRNWLVKIINEKFGWKHILVLYAIYAFCMQLLLSNQNYSIEITLSVAGYSLISWAIIHFINNIKSTEEISKEELEKNFFSFDGLFFCMFIILSVLFCGLLIYSLNIEDAGKSALSHENTYTEIESGVEFESHKDADGYLLFKTISQKNIAIAYKKCDKDGNPSKNAKGNYIKILKGYKYVDLDDLEISDHNYIVKVDK